MTKTNPDDGGFRALVAPLRQVMPEASDEKVEEAARNLLAYVEDTDSFHAALLTDPERYAKFSALRDEQDFQRQLDAVRQVEEMKKAA